VDILRHPLKLLGSHVNHTNNTWVGLQ
jgi:hypothetical protein